MGLLTVAVCSGRLPVLGKVIPVMFRIVFQDGRDQGINGTRGVTGKVATDVNVTELGLHG